MPSYSAPVPQRWQPRSMTSGARCVPRQNVPLRCMWCSRWARLRPVRRAVAFSAIVDVSYLCNGRTAGRPHYDRTDLTAIPIRHPHPASFARPGYLTTLEPTPTPFKPAPRRLRIHLVCGYSHGSSSPRLSGPFCRRGGDPSPSPPRSRRSDPRSRPPTEPCRTLQGRRRLRPDECALHP